jgi:hypothetical protein
MPRLSLAGPAEARTRLRQQKLREGMSTLEAIGAALARLEGPEPGAALDALSAAHVAATVAARGQP